MLALIDGVVSYLISNSSDSGSGRSCSGPRLFRSRDLDRLRVGLSGTSGSIASEDRSLTINWIAFFFLEMVLTIKFAS